MRLSRFIAAAVAACFALGAGSVRAQTLYSFEAPPTNPDGFGPNGGGVTVTQDTIGATHLVNSMKVSVVPGATFVGALTPTVNPLINDPPGITGVLVDVTLTEPFAGNFASLGVTIFGASQPGPGQQFGLQAQFADFEPLEGKAAGTYTFQIDFNSATHPLTFATGQSFNDIFGTVGSGPNDLIPTGFQFFLNKSGTAPITFYVDNVRLVPEPGTLAIAGALAGLLLARRRPAR
jgi:hypothetical protein